MFVYKLSQGLQNFTEMSECFWESTLHKITDLHENFHRAWSTITDSSYSKHFTKIWKKRAQFQRMWNCASNWFAIRSFDFILEAKIERLCFLTSHMTCYRCIVWKPVDYSMYLKFLWSVSDQRGSVVVKERGKENRKRRVQFNSGL